VKIEYAKLRDDAKELAYSLEQKIKDLMEKRIMKLISPR
jgi:hypothetical protein